MTTKVKFDVLLNNDKLMFFQTITREIPLSESLKELNKLKSEIMQVQQQSLKVKKDIENDALQNELDKISMQLEGLEKVEEKWTELIKPEMDKLRKELKTKVASKRAEVGYERLSKEDDKMIKRNKIIADIATEMELDVSNPLLMEVRREFDKK